VAVIPGADEDEVWMLVTRNIKGAEVTYLEQMQPRDYGELEDAWFVDSGLKYDEVVPATTFTGLEHLEGERVAILADGTVRDRKIVDANGEVTVAVAASKAIIGLPNRFTFKPMRFDLMTQRGTSKGSLKTFKELVISFLESNGAQYGVDVDNLFDIPPSVIPSTGLYTGDAVVNCEGGFNVEDSIIITGDKPLPCVVRAMIPRIQQPGR